MLFFIGRGHSIDDMRVMRLRLSQHDIKYLQVILKEFFSVINLSLLGILRRRNDIITDTQPRRSIVFPFYPVCDINIVNSLTNED